MKLVAFLLLNTLALNALSAEEPSDFEKGLRVLLELELNKFESCLKEGKTDCDDSEVDSFLSLLGEGRSIEKPTPHYPRAALNRGLSGEVIVQVIISRSGQVIEAVATSCIAGEGSASLKYRWEEEGRVCNGFRKEAERTASKWSYSPVTSLDRESYSRKGKVIFELVDEGFDPNNSEYVEIKIRDAKKIDKLKRQRDWKGLKEYVWSKQQQSPVFNYHLAFAQQRLGESAQAIASLERFLERAKNQYFHFGAQAAQTVIDARYAQENDDAVVAAGKHYSLMNYYLNGNRVSKYRIGLSIMRLASSKTLVRPQQLGKGLGSLIFLKNNIELVEDPVQRADLEAQVDAQLENLRKQISQIGARATST